MDKAGKSAVRRIFKIFIGILIVSLIFSLSLFIFTTREGVSLVAVRGDSMNPTFKDKDTLVLQQAEVPENGQIVVIQKPAKWSDYAINARMIKRLVGVPGDTFNYDGETIKINDNVLVDLKKDDYKCSKGKVGYNVKLNDDQFLVMGDNKNNSLDSVRIFCDGNSDKMFLKSKNIYNNGTVRYVL